MDSKQLKLNKITNKTLSEIRFNKKLFNKFFNINKGFIDEIVLKNTHRDKGHPDYNDLFQTACVGLLKAIDKFDDSKATFSTFAYRVIDNEIKMEFNKLNKQRNIKKNKKTGTYKFYEIPMDYITRKYKDDKTSVEINEYRFKSSPTIDLLRNFEEQMINKTVFDQRVKNLNELEFKIYDYHYINNMSLKETAKKMGTKYGTLKRLFYKGVKQKIENMYCENA